MAWFKKTRKPIKATTKESRVPEGLWVKCPSCGRAIYNKELVESLKVCDKCGHHFRMGAAERLKLLFDDETWTEHDAGLRSLDPLKFTDTKPYRARLESSIKASGLNDAIIVGSGTVDGLPTVIAAMEYNFIGGSMGVVVGEKITRGAELALSMRAPFIIVSCSGGARMMEGALSLMQMAKISAALGRCPFDRDRVFRAQGAVTGVGQFGASRRNPIALCRVAHLRQRPQPRLSSLAHVHEVQAVAGLHRA